MASLSLSLLVFMDALETSCFLLLVEGCGRAADVGAMPRGVNEAPLPRFMSEAGREVFPVLSFERARELAIRTLTPGPESCRRIRDDLFATRGVADKDTLFFSGWKR